MKKITFVMEGGKSFDIPAGKGTVLIGRQKDCDVQILVDRVSRKHCKIIIEENAVKIVDLGSSNGTFVNGEKLERGASATIQDGAKIQVSQKTGFTVKIDDEKPDRVADNKSMKKAVAYAMIGGAASHPQNPPQIN